MLAVGRSRGVIVGVATGTVVIVALFVALAYQHFIIIPYLSPTTITVNGLNAQYPAGATLSYTVKVDGYGSNCLSMTSKTFLVTSGQDKEVYFYKKADDCKHMDISYGQYNYIRTLTYGGQPITGAVGQYKVVIDFVDLMNGQKASKTAFFTILQ